MAAEYTFASPDGRTWELTRYPRGKGGQQAGMPNLCFRCGDDDWRVWSRYRGLIGLKKAIEAGDYGQLEEESHDLQSGLPLRMEVIR